MIRLDKYLCDMGCGSRSELKKVAKEGRISVDGRIIRDSSFKLDPGTAGVELDGRAIIYEKYVYFMLNKPAGVISASSGSATVMDLIHEPFRDLFPCGRLDRDTEGLLLITNDGPLAHQLLSPAHHVDKEYECILRDPVSGADIRRLAEGMIIDGGEQCLPAFCTPAGDHACRIILQEGKFHEVKRLFLALGNEVTFLRRIRMKNLVLDESLAPGCYRRLSEAELQDLRSLDQKSQQESATDCRQRTDSEPQSPAR